MKNALNGLALCGLIALSQPAIAKDPKKSNPVDDYHGHTLLPMAVCQAKVDFWVADLDIRRMIGRPEDDPDLRKQADDCVASLKADGKTKFSRALRAVKRKAAQEQLKNYHVLFMSAATSIFPEDGERKIDFDRRRSAMRGRLNETWQRFEIEND